MRNPFKVINDLFDKYGHVIGEYGDVYVGFCSVGAIRHANHYGLLNNDEAQLVVQVLQERIARKSHHSIPQWNDLSPRREVLGLWKQLEAEWDQAHLAPVTEVAEEPEEPVKVMEEPVAKEVTSLTVTEILAATELTAVSADEADEKVLELANVG